MLAAVDLDNQLADYASEIDYVGAYRDLAAEALALDLFGAQTQPQETFSVGHARSQPRRHLNL